jgi:hypothetical protein
MLNIETTTKLGAEEVIKRAVKFFGPEGYGLAVKEQDGCSAAFEGGGGGVAVSATAKGKGAAVVLESREWDYQVREFIRKIK